MTQLKDRYYFNISYNDSILTKITFSIRAILTEVIEQILE